MPARASRCSKLSLPAMACASYSCRPCAENMHGSDTSVLLPQAVTSVKFTTLRRASSGVVWRR